MTDEIIEEIIEIDGREYQGFEWYENKNESNIDEHKIDFMDAKELFLDDDFVNTTARTVKGRKEVGGDRLCYFRCIYSCLYN